jgi:protein NirF
MSRIAHWLLAALAAFLLSACVSAPPRGTGDLGLVIERASGHVTLVDTSSRSAYARIGGLGDLSHASVVYSRDARYAFVFGRDGGLTKIDLLEARIVKRVMQSGNAIGGSISQDGRIVVAQNYTPGGIKAFDVDTLDLLSEVPAEYAPGRFSKVVGLADVPGNRFAYALFDGGEIRISDFSDPKRPVTTRYPAGQQPYDGLVTPDGRHYLAGLFGEDGIALLDLWQPEKGARKILEKYGRGEEKLPVFKMPHLRGWSVAAGRAWLPAIGRHEVLVADAATWQETGRVAVKGQPVFVMASPDGRQIWVNFRLPRQRLGAGDRHPERASSAHPAAGQRPCCTWNSRRVARRCGSRRVTTTASSSTTRGLSCNSAACQWRRRPEFSSAVVPVG